MKMQMTLDIARAIGIDAGNASMRQAGRSQWSQEDYNVSTRAMLAVLPPPPDDVDEGKE